MMGPRVSAVRRSLIKVALPISSSTMNSTHYIDKAGIWSAFEGVFATKNVLAFSRGDSVNINHSPHDGLVIINKGNG